MADYGIYKVRFNINHSKIREVHVYNIKVNTININESITMDRDTMISKINSNNKLVTLIQSSEGDLQIGSEVKIYKLGHEDFIKTEENDIKQDNLDKLVEY